MAKLTDEVLLKRAKHAGRNLFVLAALVTFVALIFVVATIAGESDAPVSMIAVAAALLAAGYWTLAHAARRGNSASVTIVIVTLLFLLVSSFVSIGIAGVQGRETHDVGLGLGILVQVLICVSLWQSRSVILQLKERNLWEQVFGGVGPSRNACIVGGVLLVVGYLGMIGAGAYGQATLRQNQRVASYEASLFLDVVKNEENNCMVVFKELGSGHTPDRLDAALLAVERLERKVAEIKPQITMAQLRTIVDTYGLAVQSWKNGIIFLRQEEPDLERAQRALARGDQFRAEAGQSFDTLFSPSATN